MDSGLRCNCVCPGCLTPLIARHSPSGRVRPHFAHASETACVGGLESALHLAAKQLIADRRALYLPELGAPLSAPSNWWSGIQHSEVLREGALSELQDVRLEEKVGCIRPDLFVKTFDQEIMVEIANTHFVTPEKFEHIRRQGVATIEVDVSDLVILNFEALAKRLFEATPRAKWVFHPELAARELELQPLLAAAMAEALLKSDRARADEASKAENRREREARRDRERQAAKHLYAEERARRIAMAIARPQEEKLADALAFLGPAGSDVDSFLPIRVRGGSSIDARPLIWQIVTFAGVVHPALKKGNPSLSADSVRTWISERFKVDTSSSSMAVAVWDFLSGLAELGVLHKARRQEFLVAVPDVVGALEVAADAQENGSRELVWGETWPSPKKARTVAEVFATIYGHKYCWDRLAGLLPDVSRIDPPAATLAYYRRPSQGAMDGEALRRYFLSTGFAHLLR